MWRFMHKLNRNRGLKLDSYPELYKWSIDNISSFWEELWDFVGIIAFKKAPKALNAKAPMYPRPKFFAPARLNFAKNLLFPPVANAIDASSPAVITLTELPGNVWTTSWAQLREAVRQCSRALRTFGLEPGHVVAGYVSNHVEAIIVMLGATCLGAVWTSISSDAGVSAVLDRLVQTAPKILFADNGTIYNGKEWPSTSKTNDIVAELVKSGLHTVVVINNIRVDLGISQIEQHGVRAYDYDSFLAGAPSGSIFFRGVSPSHPLYILYSSGTTGLPKLIVHTTLGTLLQHKKEHKLHGSMSTSSHMLCYTTTSWMMWHWSVSALATGASLVVYSGSPFQPHSHLSLARVLSDLSVTHFVTSAAYLTTPEVHNVRPAQESSIDLSGLEAIYSTASPLPSSTFRFVYDAFPIKVHLASITGGTDIISLFGAPCPLLPVCASEVQCAGLDMDIRVVDAISGEEVTPGEPGDLVCVKPFPCQPLTFFGPNGDARYEAAYFQRFRNICGAQGAVWHHGDFVKMPDPASRSLFMLGRSDGVLKPAGVRFGSAEIYGILKRFFAIEIEDAVCVGRRGNTDADETACLFAVMAPGQRLGEELKSQIKAKIRSELSPRHVPAIIEECGGGIPKTSNGKKIEIAVKHIISGTEVQNNASVSNPEALDWFRHWAETH